MHTAMHLPAMDVEETDAIAILELEPVGPALLLSHRPSDPLAGPQRAVPGQIIAMTTLTSEDDIRA